jgi:8-hydroxy-5-deazaflavin:NADPH oxidoreductase
VLANSRGPESLASEVSTLGEGASAGMVDEAAGAGIVVIAVPWPRVPDAVKGLHWDAGDDPEAKSEVSTLFEDAGFVAIDLGGLVSGGAMQQLGGPLAGVNLIELR